MFTPNLNGTTFRLKGHDLHGEPSWSSGRNCPFAMVNFGTERQKTSVRADSSASRGSADERVMSMGKILVAVFVADGIRIGDRFEFGGRRFSVMLKHDRYSVLGRLDHYEIDIELLPS